MISVPFPLPPRADLKRQYEDRLDAYDKLLFELQRRTKGALKNCGIGAAIKHRVKTFDSFYQKLLRQSKAAASEVDHIEINDVLALRIICPFLEDVAVAERCIRAQFTVCEVEHKGAEFSVREFGYRSVHCLIDVPPDLLESFHLPEPFRCEFQMRTILQDAWAEVEHELVYKAEFTPFGENIKRKLAALNANLSLSDITFQEIRDYQRSLQEELDRRRALFWDVVGKATGDADFIDPDTQLKDGDSATLGVSAHLLQDEADQLPRVGAETGWSEATGGLDRLLLEALRAHNAGNFDKADEVYSQILRAQPRVYVRAIVLLHRGIARMAAGRYDAARSDIDDALQLDPENWRGYFYRGTIHRVKGSVTEAEQDFSRCLDLDPYQVECLFQRALLYVDTGRPRQALSDAARAVELAPENAAVMQLLEKLRSNNE